MALDAVELLPFFFWHPFVALVPLYGCIDTDAHGTVTLVDHGYMYEEAIRVLHPT